MWITVSHQHFTHAETLTCHHVDIPWYTSTVEWMARFRSHNGSSGQIIF